MMRRIYLISISLLIISIGIYNGAQALDITEDTTWDSDQVLTESVYIYNGATLTIEPGVTIKAEPGKDITLACLSYGGGGILDAQGTEAEPIIFTSNASNPSPGDWKEIQLGTGSDSSVLKHCIVEYAGSYLGGNVDIEYASPTLEYVTSRYGQDDGIEMDSASPKIDHCKVYENLGTGITLWGTSSPVITNTEVTENAKKGVYITGASIPDLGNIGDDNPNNDGLNTFRNNAQYDVYNANPNQVKAENCIWDHNPPDNTDVYGNVDWDPVAYGCKVISESIGAIRALFK